MRNENPVWYHPPSEQRSGFWVISRHEDVSRVYKDSKAFSSQYGNVLDALTTGGDSAGGKMLSLTEGKRHREVKRTLMSTFSLKGLESLSEVIRRSARQLVQEIAEEGGGDFALKVAKQIPLQAICELLGVPAVERERIFTLVSSMVASEDPDQPFGEAWEAKNDVLLYFSVLADKRLDAPTDDIVSKLIGKDGQAINLSKEEAIFNCYSLILGGGETTRMAISGGLLAFMENPGEWDSYINGEVSTSKVVDEVLRWTSPSMHLARTAVNDLSIGNSTLRKGDVVTVWNVSANRDESVFDDSNEFDVSRVHNPHTALGAGAHFCLGSHLAKIEIGAVLEAVRDLVSEFALSGPPRRIYSNFLGGINYLPVTIRPRGAKELH